MARVALFDLDRTLIDVNSGSLWLRHEMRQGRVRWRDAAWASWWFTRYHLGLGGGLDDAFAEAVRNYRHMKTEDLSAASHDFFQNQVRSRLRPGAARALQKHRDNGDRIALASSTTQYLAEQASKAWNMELAAYTTLEVVDGELTGEITALALGEHKTSRALEWAEAQGIDLSTAAFYTDSFTDLDLMERVGEPVAINPDRRLRRAALQRGWRVEDWGHSAAGQQADEPEIV
ncbi:MAG: HAD family hydrolase [Myxococcota bacterium]